MNHSVVHPNIGEIKYETSNRAKSVSITVKPGSVRVAIPKSQSLKTAQNFVDSRISWIKKKVSEMNYHLDKSKTLPEIDYGTAQEYLTKRLDKLAGLHNFEYNRVFIRRQKSRWGSCSSKGNINLNMKLLHLPSNLVDYIILHELVHTQVKNHGKDFWNKLDKICPGARNIDRRLKDYHYCLI